MATERKSKKRRFRPAAVLILLWIGWYLSGPLAETFDFWDSPKEEMTDVVRSAGGFIALLGAAAAVSLAKARKVSQCCRASARRFQHIACSLQTDGKLAPILFDANPPQEHSPPLPLRI